MACNCNICLFNIDKTVCGLCNRNAEQIEEIGEIACFYGNKELEIEDLTCHHYFCERCRFFMHKYKVNTCIICETDISQIVSESCHQAPPSDSFACYCDEEHSDNDSDNDSDIPENLS